MNLPQAEESLKYGLLLGALKGLRDQVGSALQDKIDAVLREVSTPTTPVDLFGDGLALVHNPHRQESLWVDATPDEEYPLRILRGYRESCESRMETAPPELGELMNRWQEERAVILDRAIARLEAIARVKVYSDPHPDRPAILGYTGDQTLIPAPDPKLPRPGLKSLAEHNQERRATIVRQSIYPANGIACPSCGVEMQDTHTDTGRVLASDPPQLDVHCPRCGYRGYRAL